MAIVLTKKRKSGSEECSWNGRASVYRRVRQGENNGENQGQFQGSPFCSITRLLFPLSETHSLALTHTHSHFSTKAANAFFFWKRKKKRGNQFPTDYDEEAKGRGRKKKRRRKERDEKTEGGRGENQGAADVKEDDKGYEGGVRDGGEKEEYRVVGDKQEK